MRVPPKCVLDASVAMKLFVEEPDSDRATDLFADPSAQLHVPDLFFIECANVLWKKVRGGDYARDDAAQDLADLRSMDLMITPTVELVERAFELALVHDVTAYDACYVALAEEVDGVVITADEKLHAKLGGKHRIISLSMIGRQ